MNIRLISPIPFDATALARRDPHAERPDCPHVGLVMTELVDDSGGAGLTAPRAATAADPSPPAGQAGPWAAAPHRPGPVRRGW